MDPIIHVRISPAEADKLRQTLETWRAAGDAALFACVGQSFDHGSGDLIMELHCIVAPRAITRKAMLVIKKGSSQP
jgi:hypothetical protein